MHSTPMIKTFSFVIATCLIFACGDRAFVSLEQAVQKVSVTDLELALQQSRNFRGHVMTPSSLQNSTTLPVYQAFSKTPESMPQWILFDTEQMEQLQESDIVGWSQKFIQSTELPWNSRNHPIELLIDSIQKSSRGESMLSVIVRFSYLDRPLRDAYVHLIFAAHQPDGAWSLREVIDERPLVEDLPPVVTGSWDLDELKDRLQLSDAALEEQKKWWVSAIPSSMKRDDFIGLTPATEFTFKSSASKTMTVVVEDSTGLVLQAYHHHLHASEQTKRFVKTRVYQNSYLDETSVPYTMPYTSVSHAGFDSMTTADGLLLNDQELSLVRLESDRALVLQSGERSAVELRPSLDSQDNYEVYQDDLKPAINAYAAAHRINRFVRQYVSEQELPFLSSPIEITVDMDGSCNAYYTTVLRKISLFRAGDGCADVALINDVIYHEWGHGLDDHTGIQVGVTDGAFSEGLSDVVAAFFTGEPEIGRGFLQDRNYGIRNISRFKKYPDDVGSVHSEGGIIANTFWSLRLALELRWGQKRGRHLANRLFFRHLLDTDSYLDSYRSVLRVDDDDGNPATRSPNHCLINKVFAERGLAVAENCQDAIADAYELTQIDRDLTLALTEAEKDQVFIVASSQWATQMDLCWGDRTACLQADAPHVALNPPLQSEDRRFFVSNTPHTLKALDLITLIAKNEQGEIIGSRVLKAVEK